MRSEGGYSSSSSVSRRGPLADVCPVTMTLRVMLRYCTVPYLRQPAPSRVGRCQGTATGNTQHPTPNTQHPTPNTRAYARTTCAVP